MEDPVAGAWRAYHLYYYDPLDRPLRELIHPLAVELWRGRKIDRFFFVRYGLGGPHIRLRVRPVAGLEGEIERIVRQRTEAFLALSPSTRSLDDGGLRRATESILAADPNETDSTVYPDNTLIEAPFHPEVERYGGPRLLPHSFDFFTVSSVAALDFLARYGEEPRSRQLILALQLLSRQAVSFAREGEELSRLLSYGVLTWGESMAAILAKADRVFAGQREELCRLMRAQLTAPAPALPPSDAAACLHLASALLSQVVGDDERRRGIGTSQLHMTATRLGLSNPEEAYLSRLLQAAVTEVLAAEPGLAGSPGAPPGGAGARGTPGDVVETVLSLLGSA